MENVSHLGFCLHLASKGKLMGRPFLGLLDIFCFFYKVVLSDKCPQPLFHGGKFHASPGNRPSTFGVAFG
jgi:hypothetical protein